MSVINVIIGWDEPKRLQPFISWGTVLVDPGEITDPCTETTFFF